MRPLVILPTDNGRFILGIPSVAGLSIIEVFSSLTELKSFAMGILGFCEHFSPEIEIPQSFIDAFREEQDGR